ncbi:uncharacterized protein EV422DRAFT_569238 [Fimicolochytrium jonesii]|uniref:uncharacterized protein n=1 Tax=Fimicolochytrium jonesii TaxID=1396493 RepID=UPI0022FEB852|nr:uncharacterized protein EV422DRAFT_569238 [Fimicolochytrium jonesii]KAI8818961.1 hypothetical protein EV422DRAFT_569238 [Fimicolochytrium jonesii]
MSSTSHAPPAAPIPAPSHSHHRPSSSSSSSATTRRQRAQALARQELQLLARLRPDARVELDESSRVRDVKEVRRLIRAVVGRKDRDGEVDVNVKARVRGGEEERRGRGDETAAGNDKAGIKDEDAHGDTHCPSTAPTPDPTAALLEPVSEPPSELPTPPTQATPAPSATLPSQTTRSTPDLIPPELQKRVSPPNVPPLLYPPSSPETRNKELQVDLDREYPSQSEKPARPAVTKIMYARNERRGRDGGRPLPALPTRARPVSKEAWIEPERQLRAKAPRVAKRVKTPPPSQPPQSTQRAKRPPPPHHQPPPSGFYIAKPGSTLMVSKTGLKMRDRNADVETTRLLQQRDERLVQLHARMLLDVEREREEVEWKRRRAEGGRRRAAKKQQTGQQDAKSNPNQHQDLRTRAINQDWERFLSSLNKPVKKKRAGPPPAPASGRSANASLMQSMKAIVAALKAAEKENVPAEAIFGVVQGSEFEGGMRSKQHIFEPCRGRAEASPVPDTIPIGVQTEPAITNPGQDESNEAQPQRAQPQQHSTAVVAPKPADQTKDPTAGADTSSLRRVLELLHKVEAEGSRLLRGLAEHDPPPTFPLDTDASSPAVDAAASQPVPTQTPPPSQPPPPLLLTLPLATLKQIKTGQARFLAYQRAILAGDLFDPTAASATSGKRMGRDVVDGPLDPWDALDSIADEILDDVIGDNANEFHGLADEFVDRLFDEEFLPA